MFYDLTNFPSYKVSRDQVTADTWKKYEISHSNDGSTFKLKVIDEDGATTDPEIDLANVGAEKSTLVISIGGAVSSTQGITRMFDGSIKEFKWYVQSIDPSRLSTNPPFSNTMRLDFYLPFTRDYQLTFWNEAYFESTSRVI